jgi:pyridoxal phosphate-dependent aminotransferase EpsN
VVVVEDAAEALGSRAPTGACGSFGAAGVFSFNGNKIVTTSGGGMLVSDDEDLVARARFLATQARDPALHYEHSTIGWNYRLSNLLAAIGRGQLRSLDEKISHRGALKARYREAFRDVEGIELMPEAPGCTPNHWLTVVTVDAERFGARPVEVIEHLASLDIEARPAWKPMHLQPAYAGAAVVGGAVAERVFRTGVCLPSGSSLGEDDQQRVVDAVLATPRATTALG